MPETGAHGVSIGIDGGASKTHIVALDSAGRLIAEGRGPAATLNGRADTAWSAIFNTLDSTDLLAGLSLAGASIVVGIAGTEFERTCQEFVATAPQCAAFEVVSDAHIACAGAHDLTDGAAIAVGTGVVGFCRAGGHTARVGGWGFPHDDQGGGAWLGMRALNLALAASDGRRARDALSDRVLAGFDADVNALSAWASTAGAGEFARHARVVTELAQSGCASADALLDEAGMHVSTLARALLGDNHKLALALTGGLAQTIAPRLDDDLCARLTPAAHDGAYGAALMARQAFVTTAETHT